MAKKIDGEAGEGGGGNRRAGLRDREKRAGAGRGAAGGMPGGKCKKRLNSLL